MIKRDNYQGGIITLETYLGDYPKYMQVYLMLSATCLCLNKGSSNLLSPESGEHIPTKPQNLDRILNIHQFSCIGFSNLLRNINKILAVGA